MSESSEIPKLDESQKHAHHMAMSGENVLITGAAGTGKSFIIKRIIDDIHSRDPMKNVALVATTGKAALSIGGVTIHSFFGIGLGTDSADNIIKKMGKISVRNYKAKPYLTTNVLIIDECSMLNVYILELIDCIARRIRRSDKPMGGIQVVFVGDFSQLAPVYTGAYREKYKDKEFIFQSELWDRMDVKVVNLSISHRQDGDSAFIEFLHRVRFAKLNASDRTVLIGCTKRKWESGSPGVYLAAKNDVADRINQARVDKLETESKTFKSRDTWSTEVTDAAKKVFDKRFKAPSEMTLKIGAFVMLTQNISVADGLVNGSTGFVRGFTVDGVQVEFTMNDDETSTGIIHTVGRITEKLKESMRVDQDDESKINGDKPSSRFKVVSRAKGTRDQIPLRLAWAISIHRSQGMTMNRIIIDTKGFSMPGMCYVALSRARSLDGVRIVNMSYSDIKADPSAINFYDKHKTLSSNSKRVHDEDVSDVETKKSKYFS